MSKTLLRSKLKEDEREREIERRGVVHPLTFILPERIFANSFRLDFLLLNYVSREGVCNIVEMSLRGTIFSLRLRARARDRHRICKRELYDAIVHGWGSNFTHTPRIYDSMASIWQNYIASRVSRAISYDISNSGNRGVLECRFGDAHALFRGKYSRERESVDRLT